MFQNKLKMNKKRSQLCVHGEKKGNMNFQNKFVLYNGVH